MSTMPERVMWLHLRSGSCSSLGAIAETRLVGFIRKVGTGEFT
jgi:hypothetical protein